MNDRNQATQDSSGHTNPGTEGRGPEKGYVVASQPGTIEKRTTGGGKSQQDEQATGDDTNANDEERGPEKGYVVASQPGTIEKRTTGGGVHNSG